MTNEESIHANAQLVLTKFADQGLGFDEASVAWIDGFIERNRASWDADTRSKMVSILGSFLGECVIANFGGGWTMTENGLGVMFDERNGVFPFNKVEKQIENGSEDSIDSFYQAAGAIFKR